MEMRDRLIELIYCSGRNYDDYVDGQHEIGMSAYEDFDSWLADDLLANGVIVPPCKVGDWLWVVRKDYVSESFRVDGFDDRNLVMYMQDNEHNLSLVYKGIKIWRVSFDDFGKSVFLTKGEAEAKLKEREGNG